MVYVCEEMRYGLFCGFGGYDWYDVDSLFMWCLDARCLRHACLSMLTALLNGSVGSVLILQWNSVSERIGLDTKSDYVYL